MSLVNYMSNLHTMIQGFFFLLSIVGHCGSVHSNSEAIKGGHWGSVHQSHSKL